MQQYRLYLNFEWNQVRKDMKMRQMPMCGYCKIIFHFFFLLMFYSLRVDICLYMCFVYKIIHCVCKLFFYHFYYYNNNNNYLSCVFFHEIKVNMLSQHFCHKFTDCILLPQLKFVYLFYILAEKKQSPKF